MREYEAVTRLKTQGCSKICRDNLVTSPKIPSSLLQAVNSCSKLVDNLRQAARRQLADKFQCYNMYVSFIPRVYPTHSSVLYHTPEQTAVYFGNNKFMWCFQRIFNKSPTMDKWISPSNFYWILICFIFVKLCKKR